MSVRFLIIGGGPAGNTAATYAARLGAEVVMVEREIVGGAAHLLDCIPSKTMIATGGAMTLGRKSAGMGLEEMQPEVDVEALDRGPGGGGAGVAGEVDDGVGLNIVHHRVHGDGVGDVGLNELVAGIARDRGEIVQVAGVGQLVEHGDCVRAGRREEKANECGPDEAGPSGNE